MWHNVWPSVPTDEVPIKHVTNGIHVRTWLAQDVGFTLDRYLSEEWKMTHRTTALWEGVMQIPMKSCGVPMNAAAPGW